MSSLTADRLYALLPAVYRLRDAEQGGPLRALLAAFAQELAGLEENLEQLYDDQFIETCAEWVVPYLGDLIGYRPLHGASSRVSSPRAEVAHTIAYRRRKGTALMLEEVAHDVTDWPSHAVEFFERLATTQSMKHLRLHAPATADLRDLPALRQEGGAFGALAHTPEMRRPERGAGRYGIPNVGVYLWRLLALRLSAVPLTPDPGDASGRKFRVNPLGADLQLFRRAQTEGDIGHLSEPANVPEPLGVRLMAAAVRRAQASAVPPPDARLDDDYGPGESLVLLRPGNPPTPLAVGRIRVCDLRDVVDAHGNVGWNHEAGVPAGVIGIDPQRGRVLLGAAGDGPLLATFHYGQPRRMGGGEYARSPEGDGLANQRAVLGGGALQPQLDAISGGGRLLVQDSRTYRETPVLKVDGVAAANAAGNVVVVAAGNPARPLVAAGGNVAVALGARGRLVIDGLVFSGGALRVVATADSSLRELVLRDCTLVPGRSLQPDGTATSAGAPALIVEHPFARVTLEGCITGPVHAVADATVELRGCIVDAGAPEAVAFAADAAGRAGAELTVSECTLVGKVHTRTLRLASDTIFWARLGAVPDAAWSAPLVAERKQEGCVRFSYLPPGSVTPSPFRCVSEETQPAARPHFTSLRFGDPGYCQLRRATDASIREGASDGNEMGAMHPLSQAQRESNLRIRLDEYLRFGLHAGIFYAT